MGRFTNFLMPTGRRTALITAYRARVIARPVGCWGWGGLRDKDGYGLVPTTNIRGKRTNVRANRVSWEIHKGPIPPGHDVLHKCDNPPCTRPDHLFTGTTKQNSEDMVAKGRSSRGERHPGSRLTADIVRDIRRRAAAGESGEALAQEVGVSYVTIRRIITRVDWAHVV